VDIIARENVGENLVEVDWEGSSFVGDGAGGRIAGTAVSEFPLYLFIAFT